MTGIPVSSFVDIAGDVEAVRAAHWEGAWSEPWEGLAAKSLVPRCKISEDVWQLPKEWAAAGAQRSEAYRSISFARALPSDWDRSSDRSEAILRRLKRLAVLMFVLTPASVGRGRRSARRTLAPSTWASHVRILLRFTQRLLTSHGVAFDQRSSCPEKLSIFGHLTPKALLNSIAEYPDFARALVPRLNALVEKRLIDDWPSHDVSVPKPRDGAAWLPFEDSFLGKLGPLALWTSQTLGPLAVECWSEVAGAIRDPSLTRKRLRARYSVYKSKLGPPEEFPLLLKLRGDGNRAELLSQWPPQNLNGVRQCLALAQMANATILLLALGLRTSELTELRRDCLRQFGDELMLAGSTFKLSEQREGAARRWPLPEVAIAAVRRQQQIGDLLKPKSPYLFVPSQGPGDLMVSFRVHAFAETAWDLTGIPVASSCTGTIHTHRFRKSVARLAALTLLGAGQTLFEIFGHRDPEMTLGYILSDPDLQDEIRIITKEASIALAAEAIATAEENGGNAALKVKALADRLTPRLAGEDLDETALRRAAQILSQDGSAMLVRQNVLCTKTFNQFGPCTRRAGAPDAGNCDVGCGHRLELAAAKADHVAAIEQILSSFAAEDEFSLAWWRGQLQAHLAPFPEIAETYADDSRFHELVGQA